jgi:hypothetical protein
MKRETSSELTPLTLMGTTAKVDSGRDGSTLPELPRSLQKMSDGHAQAILENREGALRAIEDFKAGVTANPFPRGGGWQRLAWETKMEKLICRRDHGIVCCQEHNQHLAGRFNKSHMGLTSCNFCEKEVEEERKRRIEASK